MSSQYSIFLRAVIVALVVALAPLLAANMILNNYAENRAMTELRSMGESYIQRAEAAINATVGVLQRLDRDEVRTCAVEDRHIFQNLVIDTGEVEAIGLVDREGKRMCVAPDTDRVGKSILPALRPDGPLVGIGMLDKKVLGARVALVSWKLNEQVRLFAEITPTVVTIEPGPQYLKTHRRVELRLGDGILWYSAGGYSAHNDAVGESMTVVVNSTRYPLKATLVVPHESVVEIVSDLKIISVIACVALAFILVALSVWFSWRPENEAYNDFVLAIKNNEFIPYYQPVMDIQTGALRGCEVLMRWQRPDGTMISPGQFMAYAEANGHIFEMTRSIMKKVVVEVGKMHEENPDIKLSINLFAGHFLNRDIINDIRATFEKSPISYQQILVEVTERYPLEDMDLARKIIAELQALGVRVALDDVGTGHGGMAYLQKLGIDVIKIDKMFIDSIGNDDSSTTIVDSMVELADNLGMGIIAEGVETEDQVERLREMGVTAAQGYYFAKPMPAKQYINFSEELEEKLANELANRSNGTDEAAA